MVDADDPGLGNRTLRCDHDQRVGAVGSTPVSIVTGTGYVDLRGVLFGTFSKSRMRASNSALGLSAATRRAADSCVMRTSAARRVAASSSRAGSDSRWERRSCAVTGARSLTICASRTSRNSNPSMSLATAIPRPGNTATAGSGRYAPSRSRMPGSAGMFSRQLLL